MSNIVQFAFFLIFVYFYICEYIFNTFIHIINQIKVSHTSLKVNFHTKSQHLFTRSDSIDEGSDGPAIIPVCGEVFDWLVGYLALDPVEQPLFGGGAALGGGGLLSLPHGHGDGVV